MREVRVFLEGFATGFWQAGRLLIPLAVLLIALLWIARAVA